MIRRRFLYGWLRAPGEWCLSREPPDIPVRHKMLSSMEAVEEQAFELRRDIIWSGAALQERQRLNLPDISEWSRYLAGARRSLQ